MQRGASGLLTPSTPVGLSTAIDLVCGLPEWCLLPAAFVNWRLLRSGSGSTTPWSLLGLSVWTRSIGVEYASYVLAVGDIASSKT